MSRDDTQGWDHGSPPDEEEPDDEPSLAEQLLVAVTRYSYYALIREWDKLCATPYLARSGEHKVRMIAIDGQMKLVERVLDLL